jgi:hypothetical protein
MHKKPLSESHAEWMIWVNETQSGWFQNWTTILKKGKPDL